jgi:hypothetical protein
MKSLFWCLFVCSVLIASSLKAQDQIVTAKGDTLRVYILKSFKSTHARKLTYKIAAESTSEEVMYPSQIKSFIAGNPYISVSVVSENGIEQLLVQAIITKGSVLLYKSVDESGNPDFYIEKEGKTIPVDKSNLNEFIETHFSSCQGFSKEKYLPIDASSYRQDLLMDLVSGYNHCLDPQGSPYVRYYAPPKQKTRDKTRIGVKLGGGVQEYAYRSFGTDANLNLYGEGLFNYQPSVSGGLYGSVEYGKNFAVHLEAMYLYRNAQSTDGIINLKYSGINVPLILEFKFLNDKNLRPFINLGLNSVVALGADYKVTPIGNFQILRALSISPVSFGYMGGAGVYVKTQKEPLKIEFRFNQDFFEVNNITFGDDKMRVVGLQILASYPLL